MSSRLFLIVSVLFGLSVAEEHLLRIPPQPIRLQSGQSSNEPLIQSACRTAGNYESDCASALEGASKAQKTDANGLSIFALKYVEDHAVNLTADIKKSSSIANLSPSLQAALIECMDQYTPLGDLIEDAINAVLANVYTDAQTFIDAAVSNIAVCDTKLKSSSGASSKAGKGHGPDAQLATNLNEYNCFLKSMLHAANNVIKPSKK